MKVSLSTCLCLLSATASATLPPLGNKDILYPTLQSAREAATLVNEAQPLVGRCNMTTQLCHLDLYVPRWGVGRGYILYKRATRYRCSPDSACNELGQTCMHRWDPDMTICDYVHVIAEQAEPGCVQILSK